jgi:hypothetical protein
MKERLAMQIVGWGVFEAELVRKKEEGIEMAKARLTAGSIKRREEKAEPQRNGCAVWPGWAWTASR